MTFTKTLAALGASLLATSISFASDLSPTTKQAWTLRAMVTELEENHYVDRRYNDAMSAEHLDTYLERLDPSHLYFTASDVAEFQRYATRLDDLGRQGELSPAFEIFNRYEQRASDRLAHVISNMDAIVDGLDFSKQEYIDSDPTERNWAVDSAELDDRWRKRIKNQVLGLKLAKKAAEEIAPTLIKRYENQQKRLSQYNEQDVFAVFANALTSQFDPHTSYFSPRRAENFDIDSVPAMTPEEIKASEDKERERARGAELPHIVQRRRKPADRPLAVENGQPQHSQAQGQRRGPAAGSDPRR